MKLSKEDYDYVMRIAVQCADSAQSLEDLQRAFSKISPHGGNVRQMKFKMYQFRTGELPVQIEEFFVDDPTPDGLFEPEPEAKPKNKGGRSKKV